MASGRGTRVLVVDDWELARRGTAAVLSGLPGITVVGQAAAVAEATTLLLGQAVDVVLLPVRLCAVACQEWAQRTGLLERLRLIVVADDPEAADLAAALRSGAAGYLLADSPVAEFAAAIAGVGDGELHVSSGLTQVLLRELARDGVSDPPLTDRELQVLRLMADGSSNRDIAERLFISENTVKNHVRHILEKTGTRSRLAAVARALRDGLVEIG
jgi:two-component system NarL family response regulator